MHFQQLNDNGISGKDIRDAFFPLNIDAEGTDTFKCRECIKPKVDIQT